NDFGGGIRISLLDEQNLEVNILNSLISKWRYGLEVYGNGSAAPNVHLYGCRIKDNSIYGVVNNSSQILTATYNEWGSYNGPYHPILNPNGSGNQVSDGILFTPWSTGTETLKANHYHVFAPFGGPIQFDLKTGPEHAGRTYLVLAGLSGTAPGTLLPGGHVILPLNWDYFTELTMDLLNSSIFVNFLGTLDGAGMAQAQLVMPPLPNFNNEFTIYMASCLCMPFDFVSNPMEVLIVP
ncbi:MAG: hypothetical protein KJ645_02890, partial [Planctomycetes bacterium]|nr:hypothetical protein [Planctomycetota bacterium]